MKPDEIPQDLVDILDERAGKKHSRSGPVMQCLAEILTRFKEMLDDPDRRAAPRT